MKLLPSSVSALIEEFSLLPGIGPKTASRLTFYLLRNPAERTMVLAEAIRLLHKQVTFCSVCFNITEESPCMVCRSEQRDHCTICIVEEPLDVIAIERTGDYMGLYHVLHGVIAPVEGVGPEDLRIQELVTRVQGSSVQELIIATNPNLEGEATAMYIARQFVGTNLKITRLARGLPVGGDLEYADEITLSRALSGRTEV